MEMGGSRTSKGHTTLEFSGSGPSGALREFVAYKLGIASINHIKAKSSLVHG